MKMRVLHLLLHLVFMATVALPLAQGEGNTVMFLGPGRRSSGQSEVFSLQSENSGLTVMQSCSVPQYRVDDIRGSVGFIHEDLLHICGGRSGSSYQSACFSLSNSSWSPTTPLQVARYGAAAVRFENGSVLVSGGWNGSSGLQSSELLTGSTWSPAMQLPSTRSGHCMLLLSSGEIFLNGGYSDSGAVSDTHISQDFVTWEMVVSSKIAHTYHACTEVTLNSTRQVWLGGSYNDPSTEIFQLVEGNWTWRDGPDLPNFSYFPGQFVSHNGKLFYAGGIYNKNIYQLKDNWMTEDDAWTKIGEMSQQRTEFPAMMITEDMCKGEKPTPTYDPELTQSDYNTCSDGSCAYVGGDLAKTFTDLLSNSSEIIEVECCTTGGIIGDTIKTCGNGTSCFSICGPHTGCLTIKADNDTDNSKTCSSSMDTENWCQQTSIIDDLVGRTCGGERKKRGLRLFTAPIYTLGYCVRKAKIVGFHAKYPECCFHPAVKQKNHCT